MSNEGKFTSRFAIGDAVQVAATVKAVHFDEAKVHYIVEISGHLFNVDSCDIGPAITARVVNTLIDNSGGIVTAVEGGTNG